VNIYKYISKKYQNYALSSIAASHIWQFSWLHNRNPYANVNSIW